MMAAAPGVCVRTWGCCPGDIRNCLLALANTEPLLEQVFQHRFQTGEGLAGHNLGNLFWQR